MEITIKCEYCEKTYRRELPTLPITKKCPNCKCINTISEVNGDTANGSI